MLKKIIIAVLISALLLTGCAHSGGTDSDAKTTDVKESQNGSVTLVIGTDWGALPSAERVRAINDYLKEKGCSYSVSYSLLGVDDSEGYYSKYSTPDYAELIEQRSDSGTIDICFARYMMDNYYKSSYDILAEDGYLYPLDEYIYSEDGKQIYDSIPAGKWASLKRNGSIYGVEAYPYNITAGPTYIINNELLAKYGYSAEDFNAPPGEITELLLAVQSGEEDREEFCCLNYFPLGYDFPGLYTPNSRVNGIVVENEENVITLFDSEEYMDMLKELRTVYRNEGISTDMWRTDADNTFITVLTGGYIPAIDLKFWGFCKDNEAYDESSYSVVYPYGFEADFKCKNAAVCILNSSSNKDEAVDFLNRMYSDKELADLAAYGREGTDYELIDGKIYVENEDGTYSPANVLNLVAAGNGFITTPTGTEVSDKQKIVEQYYSKIESAPCPGFVWDVSEYASKAARTNEVIDRLPYVLEADDFDAYIAELKEEFERVGGNELLESAKAEFKNWKKH